MTGRACGKTSVNRMIAAERVVAATKHVWHKAMIHITDLSEREACENLRAALEDYDRLTGAEEKACTNIFPFYPNKD